MLLDNSISIKLKKSLLIRVSRYSLVSQKTNKICHTHKKATSTILKIFKP